MSWWESEQSAGPRKWMFKNLSSETMPGFACIGLDPSEEGYFTATTEICIEDAQARCLQARKPTSLHETLQNPRLLAFNLKTPVLASGYGYCTFEKPAICLIDQNEAPKVNDPLGPIAGSWHLSKAGCAFVYLGDDPAQVFDWTSGSVHYGTGIVGVTPFDDLVVETPAGGIPAKTGNVYPSALCSVWRETGTIVTGSVTGSAQTTVGSTAVQIRVYNISDTAVAGSTKVATSVLKSGVRYAVQPGGGGGAEIISFRVLSQGVVFESGAYITDKVLAQVLDVNCPSASVEVGDFVHVWDPYANHFDVPMDILLGSRGVATKMRWDSEQGYYGDEQHPNYPEPDDDGCWWMVTSMACVEEWLNEEQT